jgi:hypothetical protein
MLKRLSSRLLRTKLGELCVHAQKLMESIRRGTKHEMDAKEKKADEDAKFRSQLLAPDS